MSVSCDQECLSGDDFSKTILSVRSEKRVSRRGFEKSKPLNLYSSYPGPSASHNRSISRNERSDTLDPCIKSSWSSIVQIQLPSFPFGCYTNPYTVSKAFETLEEARIYAHVLVQQGY
jgi:hypothetical protein